jgi:hypothetical protein
MAYLHPARVVRAERCSLQRTSHFRQSPSGQMHCGLPWAHRDLSGGLGWSSDGDRFGARSIGRERNWHSACTLFRADCDTAKQPRDQNGGHQRSRCVVRISTQNWREIGAMPGGDGTGPRGEGPGTGRGLGTCKGGRETEAPEDRGKGRRPRGRGKGRGRTGGVGKRRGSGRGQNR